MVELRVEQVPVGEIEPYKRNAKVHTPEQIEALIGSIRDFGFGQPLIGWHDGDRAICMSGNGRLEAARDLGMETVPVIFRDDWTERKRRLWALVDNQTTIMTVWDPEQLEYELDVLSTRLDMDLYGFGSVEDNGGEFEFQDDPDEGWDVSACNTKETFTIIIGCRTDEEKDWVSERFGTTAGDLKKNYKAGDLL